MTVRPRTGVTRLAVALGVGALAVLPAAAQTPGPVVSRAVREGIAIDFRAEAARTDTPPAALRAGDDVRFRFKLSDTAGGTPLPGLRPAAWLDLREPSQGRGSPGCLKKAATFVGGSLLSAATLDLNAYYVLAMNEDASVSVVDARFGFGGSKLLAKIFLDAPGEDWALTADQQRLFVSMPEAGRVAVVDTVTWNVVARLESGGRPGRVALPPDEQSLWVTDDGASASGVTVFSRSTLARRARIVTGRGPHDVAFSDDGALAFVTNREEGTVSIVDTAGLRKVADLKTGRRPVGVSFSALARLAYVAHEGDGAIVAVSGGQRRIVSTVPAEPGIRSVRFAPGDRYGFVVNPDRDRVHVLDASTNRLVQTAVIRGGPDQITFSATLAYVRRRGEASVLVIPLEGIGGQDAPLPIVEFPGGQKPFGRGARSSRAPSIVQVPGAAAMLVANPADRAVYYYKEGMAAPMGHFANYGHEPRAVLVVDRSLKARGAGVYETVGRLPRPGVYDVVFFVDSPRIVQCFELVAEPAEGTIATPRVLVRALTPGPLRPGAVNTIRFQVLDAATREPIVGRRDLGTLIFLSPGAWQLRQPAVEVTAGVYAIEVTPPSPGLYSLHAASPSLGLQFGNPHVLVFTTSDASPSTVSGDPPRSQRSTP